MSKLYFGWSEISITPDKKVSLSGQFAERISQYVEKPLMATAMAVSSEDEQMVLVSTDLVGVPLNLVAAIRDNFAGNKDGLDPEKIVISAIHTHTGPVFPRVNRTATCGMSNSYRAMLEEQLPPGRKYVENAKITNNDDIATDEEVYQLLIDRITQVIREAWANRKPGAYSNAFGRAVVGHCRRACFSDGSAQMWGETNTAVFTELEGGNDSGIELLYVFDEKNELTGIVANIACPAQCVEHRLFVSPDYWGEVRVRIKKHFGEHIFLLAQCSAAGDQCPVDLIRWVEPESDVNDPNINHKNPIKRKADPSMFDLSGMYITGRRVANEIIQVYDDGLDSPISDAEFIHHVQMLQLPLRRATLTDVANAKRAIREYLEETEGDVNFNDSAMLQVHLGLLARAKLQEQVDIVDTEVHTIRLGNIAFASNPFELFLDYGNQIKARSLAEQTFLIQLANGVEGYLPTEKAEKGGHYSAFIASGQVGHVGGEQLVRGTLKDLNAMFSK